MLRSDLPCGICQNNSCCNGTAENRWQFSHQEEQVNIDSWRSAVWFAPARLLLHHMFMRHTHTGVFFSHWNT